MIPVYLLNLDRSPDRLSSVQKSADELGIVVTRVPAVDGRSLTPEQQSGIDLRAFERRNGKRVLPGEIGCYLSHLKALQLIADGTADYAVIIEDDVRFTDDFQRLTVELADIAGWDMVKLINHRVVGFVKHRRLSGQYALGRCIHGPMGSSAAYAIKRDAARRLLHALRPMVVPIDVELERGWAHRASVFVFNEPIVRFGFGASTIITRKGGGYAPMKFRFYRRTGTLLYRASEYVRRAAYALASTALAYRNPTP